MAKEGGIGPVKAEAKRIRHAFLIGDAADAIAGELNSGTPVTRSGDLAAAVAAAHDLAMKEKATDPVVLLSPACASFDQFSNFEDRGDAFRELIDALPGERTEPGE